MFAYLTVHFVVPNVVEVGLEHFHEAIFLSDARTESRTWCRRGTAKKKKNMHTLYII